MPHSKPLYSRAHIGVGSNKGGGIVAGGGLGASWCGGGGAGVNSTSCALQTVRAAIHGGGGARGLRVSKY